jgi:hypothetical protein
LGFPEWLMGWACEVFIDLASNKYLYTAKKKEQRKCTVIAFTVLFSFGMWKGKK